MESDITFLVTVSQESRLKKNLRAMTLLILLFSGTVLSYLISGSWVIELAFLCLSFMVIWAIFEQRPVKERKVNMSKDELRKWLDAGCPEQWP